MDQAIQVTDPAEVAVVKAIRAMRNGGTHIVERTINGERISVTRAQGGMIIIIAKVPKEVSNDQRLPQIGV